ncbi:acetyltransferase [Spirosoma sp. KNUC1025]|uniref:acetyltransferase n=1 Tax=Spirosoma sp. KNUC1025 TaxID=2894082 RepID=UPI003868EF18|nr:acetyltransferase [Spirosoma sp. KNUC1025]
MNNSLQQGIQPVFPEDYPRLLEIWEASVRATHHFLSETDIQSLKPLVRDHAFDAVSLFCMRDADHQPVGFIGTHEGKIEMLFIDPLWRGKKVGRQLMAYAIDTVGATTVDVNEQNEQAVGFYEKLGFQSIGRSALDGQGNPFPLLHMELRRF